MSQVKAIDRPEDAPVLKFSGGRVQKIVELEDGNTLACMTSRKAINLWDLKENKLKHKLSERWDGYLDIATLGNDKLLAVCNRSVLILYNVSDGKQIWKRKHQEVKDFHICVCTSFHESQALLGTFTGRLLVFRWTGKEAFIRDFSHSNEPYHSKQVNDIFFSDGIVLSTAQDGYAKVWSAASFQRLADIKCAYNNVYSACFTDAFLVTSSGRKFGPQKESYEESGIEIFEKQKYEMVKFIKKQISEVRPLGSSNLFVRKHEVFDAEAGVIIAAVRKGSDVITNLALSSGLTAQGTSTGNTIIFDLKSILFGVTPSPGPRNEVVVIDQKESLSVLEEAFQKALDTIEIVNTDFLRNYLKPENINTTSDLYCGHNLVLYAIRLGELTPEFVRENPWFLVDGLYNPATKLTCDKKEMIRSVFIHAEKLGLINDAQAFYLVYDVRSDVRRDFEEVLEYISEISSRVLELESFAESHAKSLSTLYDALARQERMRQYASIAKCLLSMIPLLGNLASGGVELAWGLTGEQMISAGIPAGSPSIDSEAKVDLTNAHLAHIFYSESNFETLDSETQETIKDSIAESKFETIENVREALYNMMVESAEDDGTTAQLNIVSIEWLVEKEKDIDFDPGLNLKRVEMAENHWDYFNAGKLERKVTVREATREVNYLLQSKGKVSEDDVEDKFLDATDGTEETKISKGVFVGIFSHFDEQLDNSRSRAKAKEILTKFFNEHLRGGSSVLSMKMAARVLQSARKELIRQEIISPDGELSNEEANGLLIAVDKDKDGKVAKNEFISAALDHLSFSNVA